MSNVLIIAFDGMDYEKIKEIGLENIQQEEFGKIDNSTGIKRILTPELFASFITGETHEEHGVKKFSRQENDLLEKFDRFHERVFMTSKGRGKIRSLIEIFVDNSHQRPYYGDDLKTKTIFDRVEDTETVEVPSYDRSIFISFVKLFKKFGFEEIIRYTNMEQEKREEELLNLISRKHNLAMGHFHKIDAYQDLYLKFSNRKDQIDEVDDLYKEMDELAQKIKKEASENYEHIIFMSDHGLPKDEEHNKNAFYSCNKELFPDETPHITDFYDKILEIVDQEAITNQVDNDDREKKMSKKEEQEIVQKLENMGYN